MTGRGVDQILPASERASDLRAVRPGCARVRGARRIAQRSDLQAGDRRVHLGRCPDRACARGARTCASSTSRRASRRSDDYWRGKGINYRMHPENIECLTAARIDVCGLANNHVLDYGYAGLLGHARHTDTRGREDRRRRPHAGGGPDAGHRVPGPRHDGDHVRLRHRDAAACPPSWAARDDRPGVDLLPDLSEATARAIVNRVRQC